MARVGGFNVSNTTIYLNVYDLHDNNAILYPWGLGFYHSGVQIGREEYTFASQAGIFSHDAKGAPPPAKFREAIPMGTFKGTTRDLETIIQSLRPKFGGDSYHLMNNNCNSFANELMLRLTGQEIPGWINRMANMGSYCSCLMPEQQAANAPVDSAQSSGQGTGFYTRAGRNATSATTTNSTVFATSGAKLGGYGDTGSEVIMEDRREKLRAAATKRFSS